MKKNCENSLCGKLFEVSNREVRRGNGKFCGKKCFYENRRNQPKQEKESNFSCAWCGKKAYKALSKRKNSKSGLQFCDRKCKEKAQQIGGLVEIQPKHYKDGSHIKYRRLKEDVAICEKCGYNEHPQILQVHHRDRNRRNNRKENLEKLCPNCHLWEHYKNTDGLYSHLRGHMYQG